MKNGTEKYIETVAYLGKLYDFVNAKLFGGELVKPVITIQTDERNKTNGWWSVKKVWKWIDKEPANCAECDTPNDCENYTECYKPVEREEHELNMTAQQLHRPINEIHGEARRADSIFTRDSDGDMQENGQTSHNNGVYGLCGKIRIVRRRYQLGNRYNAV